MSPKQEIYREMLRLALPWIRNVSSWPWWRRARNRSAFDESELIHNLSESLFEPNFVEHDIWFLNHQARVYHDQCSPSRSPNYRRHMELIRELFALVPPPLANPPELGRTATGMQRRPIARTLRNQGQPRGLIREK